MDTNNLIVTNPRSSASIRGFKSFTRSQGAVPLLLPRDFLASPEAMQTAYTLAEAQSYTRWLAHVHYENFHVVSLLLPKNLHQDFFNVYAFCRWADDLGDEMDSPEQSLELLAWWRQALVQMFSGGEAAHPVFVALKDTAARHALPQEPFANLITAFEQDQRITRYPDWPSVHAYCVNSANPVGRLVLMLCGYRDEHRFQLSDYTCTALQLANFWQDVTVDLQKDRVYLPLDLLARHNYSEADLFARRFTPVFRAVMREAVAEAQRLFEAGLPLIPTLHRRLALDIDLFSRGGLKILAKIRAQDYNVLQSRPAISKIERASLLLAALLRLALPRAA